MAARIGVACLKSDPAKTIKACEYDPDIHRGDVLCPVERCRCELQGVTASTRTVNDEQIAVEAFFRLPSNAEKAGRGHTPVCRYNVERIVKRLVRMSEEIKRFDEDAEPLLAAARGQAAEFRLHILMETLRAPRAGWGDPAHGAPSGAARSTGTKYVRSARLLPPYLRMAKAVLSLIARVQERPELAAQVSVKYGSRTIPWDKYFFDLSDYAALHAHVAPKPETQGKQASRTVALAVKVIPGPLWHTRNDNWRVKGFALPCRTAAQGEIVVRPMLYFKDEATAARAAAQEHVLVCVIPRLGDLKPPGKKWLKPEAEVSFNIISGAQVCRYSPMLKQSSG